MSGRRGFRRPVWTTLALAVCLALVASGCGDSEDEFNGSAAERRAGTWKTWILGSPEDVKVAKPPTGSAAKAEQAEVERLAHERTPAIQEAVKKWSPEVAIKPWMDLNIELVSSGGVKDPPTASRSYAMTSIAMYDAIVAAWHWKFEYKRAAPTGVSTLTSAGDAPSYPSEHAAAAGAAAAVLTYLFPSQPPGTFDDLARVAADSRVQAGVNFRSDVEAGLALGRAVAEKVIARAEKDGYDQHWDGSRPAGIGRGPQFWEQPPGVITPPVQPLAGTWKTWAIRSGDEFRPPAPPAYGSPQFMAEAKEVLEVTRKLTDEQKRIADFWAAGAGSALPPGLWNQVAFAYLDAAKLGTPRAARVIAALNAAEADAAIAVWDTKYAYWSPRPLNAIRDLGLDPTFKSFLGTPVFPSYVSGHSGFSAAAATVLSYFFPSDAKIFEDKAQEAALSRLYGGIHFRADNEVGLEMGRKIGQVVVDKVKRDGAGV